MLRLAAIVSALAGLIACSHGISGADKREVAGGKAEIGRKIVARGNYGCTSCHSIPGMRGPPGVVGPPLDGFARRTLIAGELANTPENLVGFLYDPAALVPRTGMPDVRLSFADARNIAAFLYTLEPQ
jgi:cytochrome c2